MSAARSSYVELSELLRAVPRNEAQIFDALESLGAAIAVDAHALSQLQRREVDHHAFMAQIGGFVAKHAKEPAPSGATAVAAPPPDALASHVEGAGSVVPLLHVVPEVSE